MIILTTLIISYLLLFLFYVLFTLSFASELRQTSCVVQNMAT
jgi:hypothetical protein